MEKKKNNKKKYLALLLALFVCAGGTMAWLTSTGELTNQFTVGDITNPDPTHPGPEDPEGSGDIHQDPTKLNGNLYEPSWVSDSLIAPDYKVAKDPYVIIGPDSEDAYAFIMVKNSMNNKVSFTLEEGWRPVIANEDEKRNGRYTQGLFIYGEVLEGKESANNWTDKPLFKEVYADSKATKEDLIGGTIDVKAFVHQARNGKGIKIYSDAKQAAAECYDQFMNS